MAEIDPIELEQFNNLVDNITTDIEAGRTKANPLASTKDTIGEVVEEKELDAVTTERVEEPAVEVKATEVEMEALKPAIVIIGKAGAKIVEVTNTDGVITMYGSAAVAAQETDKSATFYRKYCKGELTDKNGNSYKYIKGEL